MLDKTTYLGRDEIIVKEAATPVKPVWEMARGHKCPVVGTCMDFEDNKRLLRKVGINSKGFKYYEMHSIIMSQLQDENPISKRVDRFLVNKYQTELARYGGMDEKEFKAVWKKAFQQGNFDGLLYVAATKYDLSSEILEAIFGEIHMLSHNNVSVVVRAKQEAENQKQVNLHLEAQLRNKKAHASELKKEVAALKRQLQERREKPVGTDQINVKSAGNSVASENKILKEKLQCLEAGNKDLREQLDTLKKVNKETRSELDEFKALNDHLKSDVEDLMSLFADVSERMEAITPKCDRPELCSKRVLIVGGMTKIRHLYKHLIESNGGEFDYHDGHMKNGVQNLNAKVGRSDLILCPVNCNSHNACLAVKKLGKKYNKPVKMLRGSGINAISEALFVSESTTEIVS